MTAYIIIMVLLFITIIAFAQRNSDYRYDFPATEPAPGQYRFFSEKSWGCKEPVPFSTGKSAK